MHLKDFSMDFSDIDGEGFRNALDRFGEQFFEQTSAKRINRTFNRHKSSVAAYIDHQKAYLEERDRELHNIIDFLIGGNFFRLDLRIRQFLPRNVFRAIKRAGYPPLTC